MAKELYIALNKKNYEGLVNGETNEVIIKKNDWWTKRLMDLDTGVFKDFDVVSISCGSSDKLNYKIEKIELRGNKFIVTVTLPTGEEETENTSIDLGDSDFTEEQVDGIEPEVISPEILEPVKVNPVIINNGIAEIKQTFKINDNGILEPIDDVSPEQDIKTSIMDLLNNFCSLPDVYVVNMPNVTIRNNGQVFGCNKKLLADKDSDVRFEFNKMMFIQYAGMDDYAFVGQIMTYLENLMKNSYLFINKKACRFSMTNSGELVFNMVLVAKKKYLFLNRR